MFKCRKCVVRSFPALKHWQSYFVDATHPRLILERNPNKKPVWTLNCFFEAKETNKTDFWAQNENQNTSPFFFSLQLIFKTSPRQTQLLWHGAGSSHMNDVNYPATNDSNTPESSRQRSDIPLLCKSGSFKCKSAFIFPGYRNPSLYSNRISNRQIETGGP